MKRSMILTLAAVAMSVWFVPSSAEAGPFQRLFGRMRGDTGVQYVQNGNRTDNGTDNGTYRRYSYEPSMERSTGTRTYRSQGARQPNSVYSQNDPRRYAY